MIDVPGTMRCQDTTIAVLTTDTDEAPWLISERGGRRYWASHDEVKDWQVREPS